MRDSRLFAWKVTTVRNDDHAKGAASQIIFLGTDPVTGFMEHLTGAYTYTYV